MGCKRAVGETSIGKAIAIATSSPFGVGGGLFHYARRAGWVDTVYLGTYRRQVFEKIGGFDEELVRNQDDEFNFRLTQSGGKIWLDPSIHSVYYARASLRKLWRQYYQYGFYKVRVIQKRQAISSWRQIVPGTFVMSFVVSCLIALITKHKRPLLWTGEHMLLQMLLLAYGYLVIIGVYLCFFLSFLRFYTLPMDLDFYKDCGTGVKKLQRGR